MPVNIHPRDLPVLLLHNVDPSWTPDDRRTATGATEQLESALADMGHPVTALPVFDADIASVLSPYHPDDAIVFNWCEELPGVLHSEAGNLDDASFLFFCTKIIPALNWKNQRHLTRPSAKRLTGMISI